METMVLPGHVPAKFYKYRPMNGNAVARVERIVLHNEIYFAPAATFNDPFDLRPVFSLEASLVRQREDYLRMSRKFQPHLTEEQHQADADRVMATSMNSTNIESTCAGLQAIHNHLITTGAGVFSASTKRDDLLMWAHYADSHKGVCLEFDATSVFMAHAQEVKYSGDRTAINPYTDSKDAMLEKALLTKSDHWSYEFEWRLIRYQGGPGAVQFPPQILTGIIFGALTARSTVELVREWVGKRSIPVTLYQATTNNTRYALDIHSC
ncbi:hypothetical protein AWV79_17340 [Cupriavidus sp. UYMMa02A]|nr:hypothetical protein AWV79_17340 [Cupriavidus sp. UYMMa02A]